MTDKATRGPVTVLGFGLTGRAVCDHAVRHGLPVAVSDAGALSASAVAWLRDHGIPFEQRGHTDGFLRHASVLVLSPGVSPEASVLASARKRGVPVVSEIAYALSHGTECTVVAVSGTNGKSSTVTAIGEILTSLGRRTWVAGNIGVPLISIVDDVATGDVLSLEVSSYQLEQSPGFHPHVGVLLNLDPDHLHRHGSLERYVRAKSHLFASQGADDVAILPRALAGTFDQGRGRRVYFDEEFPDLPAAADALMPHERLNLRAALAACRTVVPTIELAQVPMGRIAKAFRLPHRMEKLGFVADVRVVNDSKSTNAASAIAAIRAVTSPSVLLLGGRSKGAGYEALADELERSDVRSVIVFGEAAEEFQAILSTRRSIAPRLHRAATLDEAVDRGFETAQPGDVLLFSPACSSFDAFTDYAQRGEAFSAAIRRRPGFREGAPRT